MQKQLYIPCPVRSNLIARLAADLKTKQKNSKGFLQVNNILNKLYVEEIAAFDAYKRGEVVEHAG